MANKLKLNKKQEIVILGTTLVILGAVLAVHYIKPAQKPTATVNPRTDTAASSKDNGTNHPGQGSASGNTANTASGSSSTQTDPKYNSSTLAPPTQTFNKSHTPISLSETDSSKPDYPTLDSTCMTISGATCEIQASLNGVTKVVAGPKTISDSTTGIDLPWNASDEGLTPGTWSIVAVAKYNGQTSSSSPTTLVVNP